MGTEVLRPQDCLINHIRISPANFTNPRRKNNFSGEKHARRKNNLTGENKNGRRSSSFDGHVARKVSPVNSPASAPVTLLRRGQSIGDLKKVDIYAGSVATSSPSPRALPFPSFFSKKTEKMVSDELATRDLRRILGLE